MLPSYRARDGKKSLSVSLCNYLTLQMSENIVARIFGSFLFVPTSFSSAGATGKRYITGRILLQNLVARVGQEFTISGRPLF